MNHADASALRAYNSTRFSQRIGQNSGCTPPRRLWNVSAMAQTVGVERRDADKPEPLPILSPGRVSTRVRFLWEAYMAATFKCGAEETNVAAERKSRGPVGLTLALCTARKPVPKKSHGSPKRVCHARAGVTRRPVSRVLSTVRGRMGGHSSGRPLAGPLTRRTRGAGQRQPMRAPYSVLLQAGLAMRPLSPATRWALTPPFHPYRRPPSTRSG